MNSNANLKNDQLIKQRHTVRVEEIKKEKNSFNFDDLSRYKVETTY